MATVQERSGIRTGLGFKEHLTKLPGVRGGAGDGESSVPYFQRQLEAMGGGSFEVADAAAARAKVAELFPAAKVICSATGEVPGTRQIEDVRNPHDLHDVDVGVVRSPLGVAEAGAAWLTESELVVNALGVLSQHLGRAARSRCHRQHSASRVRTDRSLGQPIRPLHGWAVGHRRHRRCDRPWRRGRAELDHPARCAHQGDIVAVGVAAA